MSTATPVSSRPAAGSLLADLAAGEREALQAGAERVAVGRGEVLVREGEPADAIYLVVSGRFVVEIAGRDDPVGEIGPDQSIGEIAFLAGGVRTATVRAVRDSVVLRLGQTAFDRLAQEYPAIWRGICVVLARRLAAQTAAQRPPPDPRPGTIALVGCGGEPVPVAFTTRLIRALARQLRVELVDATRAHRLSADRGDAAATASGELDALEAHCDVLVLDAGGQVDPWSERAIRQADHVLLVGHFGHDPRPGALEQLAGRFLERSQRRLVLLHPVQSSLTGTARWLASREVRMHHHVALDRDDDSERLARFLLGEARGFIACGGGALCAAHVGLYKAMLEVGFSFDIMGGTSGGSAMTAAFALGTAPEDVDRAIHDMFVRGQAMRRYTWPRYSLLDHTHFDRQLRRHYGGVMIEDLWIPWFAVSTDLSTQGVFRHDRGDLWTAVRASSSIPVLLPPLYTRDGHMLVDGCLLDNVPIGVMRELKSGPNVVVSFEVPGLARYDVDYGALPSRRQLVRQMLQPFGRRREPLAPGLASVLMRSLMAGRGDFQQHMRDDDLLLVPPLPQGLGVLDWHRHTEVMDHAHRWCRALLDQSAPELRRRWGCGPG